MLAGPEASDWWIRGVDLPRLGVQLAQAGAANILEGASWPTAVNLLIALDGAAFSLNGEAFGKDTIGVLAPAQAFTTVAAGRNVWASINVPEALFHECCARANGVRLQGLISE